MSGTPLLCGENARPPHRWWAIGMREKSSCTPVYQVCYASRFMQTDPRRVPHACTLRRRAPPPTRYLAETPKHNGVVTQLDWSGKKKARATNPPKKKATTTACAST